MEVQKKCNDGDYNYITDLTISVKYDTARMLNGRPSSSYILYEAQGRIDFPCKLDTILKNQTDRVSISMNTNIRGSSYSLELDSKEWGKDTLAFTFYYNK